MREAFAHEEELCKPYATVIDIDYAKLPSAPEAVNGWTSEQYTMRCGMTREPGVQPELPAAAACGLQGRGQDGRQVSEGAGGE
jgi:hypothetical protein